MCVHFNIIKRKRGNVIYLYKQTYTGLKEGKRQYKEKVLGHYDENGNFIASKNVNIEEFQAEIEKFKKELGITEKKGNSKSETVENLPALPTSENFTKIRQGTATNKLARIDSSKDENIKFDPITGIAKINQKDFVVALENFKKISGLRQSTAQLLDEIVEIFTESGAKSQMVTMSFKDHMKKRGLKDEKEARKQFKEDFETLSHTKIARFTQKLKGGKTEDFFDIGILQKSGGLVNGVITVYLETPLYNLLSRYNIMPYPKLLWQLNSNKNPSSFCFLRKISEHKNMNAGKKNENIISVKTLLETSQHIPSYQKVMKKDRAFTRRIIDPFERDMNALESNLTWEYCHSNGKPLNNEELKIMSYEIFSKLYIKIIWREYPDQTERLIKKSLSKKKQMKTK